MTDDPAASDAASGDAGEPEPMTVRIDTGEPIAYLDWGGPAGPPPVVLVHGMGRTAWSWAPVARRLAARTRVLAVDLRGHGASAAPREGYDLPSLATDVLTVASANGWGADVSGPPVVVAGHGLGALVAAATAALRPASVRGLALVDAGWESMADATHMSVDELMAATAEPPEALASMEAWLADRRSFDPASWGADQERAARSEVEQKHAGHVALVVRPSIRRRLVAAAHEYAPEEVLARLDCPVLIEVAVSGGADDEVARERWLAVEDIARLRREAGLPETRVRRFEGVGHDLMRHRPIEVADDIAGLLA